MKILQRRQNMTQMLLIFWWGGQLCLPLCDNEVIKCIYLNSIYNGRQ